MPAPKVTLSVDDLSVRVSSNSAYNAAIVIAAKKGPINVPVKVSGQTDFLRRFTPNQRIEVGWDNAYHEAYQYLKTQNGLYVVRAAHTEDLNTDDDDTPVKYGGCTIEVSTSSNSNAALSSGLTIAQYEGYTFSGNTAALIAGADPGAYNNDISIKIITDQTVVRLAGAFIIEVYYKDEITPVETWTVSLNPSLKDGYGSSVFIETVLQRSLYISAVANPTYTAAGNSYTVKEQSTKLVFVGGYDGDMGDGSVVSDGDRITAMKTLANLNDVNIQLFMDGGNTTATYQKAIIDDLVKPRETTCEAIISTRIEDELDANPLNAIKTYRNTTLNINDYSVEMYTPHQKYYDEFNDRYIYLSPGPYVAALIMQVAQERGWHWAVAGYNRGIVNSLDVAVAFEPSIVDELSDIQVNTIIKDPGSGNVIWDELTQWAQASDMQDAHISRWINIFLRPNLKTMLKSFLFEFNDEQTRALLTKKVETFMEPQVAARACYDYKVVCDESNNLDDDIENNRLNCWLYVKPTKIAKWIRQRIIIAPYSAQLESLEV